MLRKKNTRQAAPATLFTKEGFTEEKTAREGGFKKLINFYGVGGVPTVQPGIMSLTLNMLLNIVPKIPNKSKSSLP